MGHRDFRVSGNIFATLAYPDKAWGMVTLTPKQQAMFVDTEPRVFVPAKGSWGRQGATTLLLRSVTRKSVRKALEAAWSNKAPKRLSSRIQGQVF